MYRLATIHLDTDGWTDRW